jgi:spore germination cell wall hydrolase CwlJ-like protein
MKHLLVAFLTFFACATSTSAELTTDDLECMALNVYHEARGEPWEGQAAVVHVTLNRVADPYFPNNICDVVWQSGQFSWTQDGRSDYPHNEDAWEISQYITIIAYEWWQVGEDFSEGATFYHADWVNPYWAQQFEETVEIGVHTFYRR